MIINKTLFGSFQNQNIDLYTLKNSNGMSVKITNYGATVTEISVPNSKGEVENVACGFDTLNGYFSKEYVDNSPYFGALFWGYYW